jgi:hypothetical protein
VIASAAHRSQNAGHQKFGDTLIQRYFVTLPDRYRDDRVATCYFDEMLCAVASAIRGFSVVRDIFQTNWETLKSTKEAALKTAERVEVFSPARKEGVWGVIVAAVIGLGLGVPIMEAAKAKWATQGLQSLALIAGSIGLSIILMVVIVEVLRSWLIGRAEQQFPPKLLEQWEDRSLKGYRTVLKQFLPLAIEITNRHYPGGHPEALDEAVIETMIERHFAFKLKSKPIVEPAKATEAPPAPEPTVLSGEGEQMIAGESSTFEVKDEAPDQVSISQH